MDLIFETQRGSAFSIEVGYFDTVLEIKGKIEKYQCIPVPKQTLVFQGNVLQDDHNIEQCDLFNNSRLHLFISSPGNNDQNRSSQLLKPEQSPQPNSTEQQIINSHQDSSNSQKKKVRVIMVVLKCGTKKIPVEVNVDDNVGELRKKVAKIRQRFELNQPNQEGYFFIYKQNVMVDDRSFQWHNVELGDTIELSDEVFPVGRI
ncbi:Ubiquitin-like domain-containing protein [Hirschfeldia incana]|nr:Ubiquitin-like domain-containing protein [Hirschfeldia incana]